MTADHVHQWFPILELCARYECSCGLTGYRNYKGKIVPHKAKINKPRKWTARSTAKGFIPFEWDAPKEKE